MKFSSIELQMAFDQAKPVLSNTAKLMNQVSEDIRLLEKYLQSQSIPEDFSYTISNPTSNINFATNSDNELISNEELLIWDANIKRIIFQHNQYNSELSEEGFVSVDTETKKIIINNPLIATPFDVRKRVYEFFLSEFLLKMAERYRIIDKDELPF